MGGCGRASDSNESAYLLQQGAHESREDKEVRGIAMSKRIVVCGDDFGMNADIDEGMIALAGMGRLSAVSCLALGPSFAVNARRLAPLNVDIGLHVNFTESLMPGAEPMPTLSRLILNAYTGRLDGEWIEAQLERQFDAFEAAFGRAPDYVDGHQHVHQLPGIRERLLQLLKRRYGARMPWLRQTAPGMQFGIPMKEAIKARVIGALGAAALARQARQDGMRTNRRLLGVYGFAGGKRRYADLLQNWLFNARDCDLLMCHPAMGNQDGCAMSRQRRAEFDVLASPKLGDWLNANGVHISRLPATAR
jgi:predicted glycoside hydrolase/deacetylase ChbG (UPF0249 family)